ncbi:protein translocase SEC61 complex subunit gamma [Candidatus Bathyarchaeota archaeon]|nr:MAG: protein translocase SEC61 complex subunit gamma [Candidatus Bathyarchaeota archaeon]
MGLIAFIQSCLRLLRLARKPSGTELRRMIKICSAGMILVGLIGYTIHLISSFIKIAFPA